MTNDLVFSPFSHEKCNFPLSVDNLALTGDSAITGFILILEGASAGYL